MSHPVPSNLPSTVLGPLVPDSSVDSLRDWRRGHWGGVPIWAAAWCGSSRSRTWTVGLATSLQGRPVGAWILGSRTVPLFSAPLVSTDAHFAKQYTCRGLPSEVVQAAIDPVVRAALLRESLCIEDISTSGGYLLLEARVHYPLTPQVYAGWVQLLSLVRDKLITSYDHNANRVHATQGPQAAAAWNQAAHAALGAFRAHRANRRKMFLVLIVIVVVAPAVVTIVGTALSIVYALLSR